MAGVEAAAIGVAMVVVIGEAVMAGIMATRDMAAGTGKDCAGIAGIANGYHVTKIDAR